MLESLINSSNPRTFITCLNFNDHCLAPCLVPYKASFNFKKAEVVKIGNAANFSCIPAQSFKFILAHIIRGKNMAVIRKSLPLLDTFQSFESMMTILKSVKNKLRSIVNSTSFPFLSASIHFSLSPDIQTFIGKSKSRIAPFVS